MLKAESANGDWVILAPTRWKLRRAVRIVNQTLAELHVEQHPDKTFLGRIDRGFRFLGYEFNTAGIVGVARPTRERFIERINQLYEQGATVARIGDYIRRWLIWVKSGLENVGPDFGDAVLNQLIPNPTNTLKT